MFAPPSSSRAAVVDETPDAGRRRALVPGEFAAALGVDPAPLAIEPLALWPNEGHGFVGIERLALSRRQFDVLLVLARPERKAG